MNRRATLDNQGNINIQKFPKLKNGGGSYNNSEIK